MKKDKKSSEGKVSITTIVKTLALRSAARGKKKQIAAAAAEAAKNNKEVPEEEAANENAAPTLDEHNIPAQAFTFRQMAAATNNFSSDNLVGEGSFGRVYRGHIQSIDKDVAIKRLDRSGLQENKEFLSEVFMLSLVNHPNLVNLIGYCADGEQRMLVHEFTAKRSLENHLLDLPEDKEPLDWRTRMKIAEGAAKGLQYLHETANPPIIYHDFKTSNILLDEEFNPKLSDFGLAKIAPAGDKDHVSTRVMGTYGYCAPEYGMTGQLTAKSDVYSFGVVFLELISGRRAIDPTKPTEEQNLVPWAEPLFKDRKMFMKMVDPLIGDNYPVKALQQALAVAAMCLQEEPTIRPLISDVVTALESLANWTDEPETPTVKPEETPDDEPESSGEVSDHENQADEPESPAEEPESPAEGAESPTDNEAEGPDDELENPTDDEADGSSDELGSPTGIIIRGNDM